MGALGLEFNGKLFSSESPLHEGRDESVFCSSAICAFSGAELQAMRRGFRGDRKCPTDFSSFIPNQEEEMAFQLFHNRLNLWKGKSERGCEPIHPYWPAVFAGQFANNKVADQMMFRRHKCKPCRELIRDFRQRGFETGIGHSVYSLSSPH